MRIDVSDDEFDLLFPANLRRKSERHFTSIAVAQVASAFLASSPGTRVLDIGSGAGKFCFVGAMHTRGYFTGVEQRAPLVEISTRIATLHNIINVQFIHANILAIDVRQYDAFYLFNPFYENVDATPGIDDSVLINPALYASYVSYITTQLAAMPSGTRIATYYGSIVFARLRVVDTAFGSELRMCVVD